MGVYKQFKKVNGTTGWKSPCNVKTNNVYGRNEWLNLKNLLYYDDSTYTICSNGVTKDIYSDNIYFYDFGFNIPLEDNLSITNVSVRFKCLNDTMGGGAIIDDLLRVMDTSTDDGLNVENNNVKNEYWSNQSIKEVIYKFDDLLSYDLTRSLVNDSSFGFTYRCKGTSDNKQVPLIYGLQVKVDYNYTDVLDTIVNSQYDVTASLSTSVISKVGYSSILRVSSTVVNNQAGVINNIYVSLSDNLCFADNTTSKVIEGKNTDNSYSETNQYTIIGSNVGIGTVSITGSNLTEDIVLTVLVENDNVYNDKLISVHNSNFNNNSSSSYGGGWYNANNSITANNYFSNNSATTAGADYYDAKTVVTPTVNEEYEVNVTGKVSCKITKYEESSKLVTSGTVTLYDDNTEVSTSSIDNSTGTAVFNYKPSSIGLHNLSFKYSGDGLKTSPSVVYTNVTVTKANTSLTIDSNNIERNTYFSVSLLDSSNNIISGATVTIRLSKGGLSKDYLVKTDTNGTAYLMISLSYGEYTVECLYDGDFNYKECNVSDTLTVTREKVTLTTEDVYMRYGETSSFKGKLLDKTNTPLKDKTVYITIMGSPNLYKTYTVTTDVEGVFTLPLTLNSMVWVFKTEFKGDDVYERESNDNVVYVYNTGTTPSSFNIETNNIDLVTTETLSINGSLLDAKSGLGLKEREVNVLIYDNDNNIIETVDIIKTDSNGLFSFNHKSFSIGIYHILFIYIGDSLYDGFIGSCTVNVTNVGSVKTILETSDYYNTLGTVKDFTARLTTVDGAVLSGETVYFKLIATNGFKQYVGTTDSDGYATLPIGISPNVFDINTTFLGDNKYNGTSNNNILVMNNSSGSLYSYIAEDNAVGLVGTDYIYKYKLYSDNNVLINQLTHFTVTNVETGERKTFKINTNNDGEASYDMGSLSAGFYWLDINYVGNSTYKSTYYNDVVLINKTEGIVTSLIGTDLELYDGEEVYYTPKLTAVDGSVLTERIILSEVIHSNGTRFYKLNKTDDNGCINQRINFTPDKYTIVNYYSENNVYRSCTGSNTVIVNNNSNTIPTTIVGSDVTLNYGDTSTFKVTLSNTINGSLLSNKTVSFEVVSSDNTNIIFTAETNTKGEAVFNINMYTGVYTVNYSFMGDKEYNQSNGSSKITVNVTSSKDTDIKTYDTVLTYNNGNIYAKLFSNGEPVTDKSLKCTLTHNTYGTIIIKTGTTNTDGLVSFSLADTDIVGEYTGIISFEGDTEYKPVSKSFVATINPQTDLTTTSITSENVVTTYNYDSTLKTVITTTTASGLLDHRLTYRFSNRKGDVYSYESEIVELESGVYGSLLSLNGIPGGFYDVIIDYPVQTTYNSSECIVTVEIEPASTSVSGGDLTVSYSNDTGFEVSVTDTSNNKPISNVYVLFQVDNSIYNCLTNSEGVAVFDTHLSLGEHSIYYKILDDGNYKTSNGSALITVIPAVTGLIIDDKTSYYTDTLLYTGTLLHYGRGVKGMTVVFTLTSNGVSSKYTAVTDSKGQAKILLNLIVGSYSVNAVFDGADGFDSCTSETKTITIKRQLTSITVYDLTEERVLNLNLIDKNKQALKDKNIILTINKGE